MAFSYFVLTIVYHLAGNHFGVMELVTIITFLVALVYIRKYEIQVHDRKLVLLRKSILKRFNKVEEYNYEDIETFSVEWGKPLPFWLYGVFENYPDEILVEFKDQGDRLLPIKGNSRKVEKLLNLANELIEASPTTKF